MFGAPFPPGYPSAVATYLAAVLGALNGTFSVPTNPALIVLCFEWQDSGVPTLTSCTIGGRAATIVKTPVNGGGNATAICAALIYPGDPNTFSVVGPVIFSGRATTHVYQVSASRINAVSAGSTATNPTATLSISANSCLIACAKGQSGGTVTPAWTGLTADSIIPGGQAYTAGHDNYLTAAPTHVVTCTLAGSVASTGAFAVFSP